MNFDPKIRIMKLPQGRSFRLAHKVVNLIVGVPLGGDAAPVRPDRKTRDTISKDAGTVNTAPMIDHLMSLVNKDLKGHRFVWVCILIILSVFLCPTITNKPSP
jgi:hypothetical protein